MTPELILYPKVSPNIEAEGKYIYFYKEKPNPKTKVWSVISKGDNIWLGKISWNGQWRKYVFASTYKAEGTKYGRFVSDIIMEEICMRDIANFIEEQTKKQKEMSK